MIYYTLISFIDFNIIELIDFSVFTDQINDYKYNKHIAQTIYVGSL